jgi:hypothetical protein
MREFSWREKMKIHKGADGRLWVFNESVSGWIQMERSRFTSEKRANILSRLVKEKMEAKNDLSYSEAFAEVQRENPELSVSYLSDLRKKR